jgi:HSP20 family molecular chaperone IbpA
MKKRFSIFEKLTGSVSVEDLDNDIFDDEDEFEANQTLSERISETEDETFNESSMDFLVDILETECDIIIQTEIAGISPDSVNIEISREQVVLSAERRSRSNYSESTYRHKEIFWGELSRSIDLPAEIDVEEAKADSEHGLLTITLPKIDKMKKTKLRIGGK